MFSFKLEGQYQFFFENDSSIDSVCCLCGAWTQVPEDRWCCDSIDAIEGHFSVHHCEDNPQEGCDFLAFRHDALNPSDSFSLSFRIRHGFDPSSQNNWQLAMAADFSLEEGPEEREPQILNGIVLGVNFIGSDDFVRIWTVDDGVINPLLSSSLNYQEQVGTELAPLFMLEGDGHGHLDLSWSPDPSVQGIQWLGSCQLEGISRGRELVLRYKYSSSRDRALWMDELVFNGHFEKDTLAPYVTGLRVVDAYRLILGFSERVQTGETDAIFFSSEDRPGGSYPEHLNESGTAWIITFEDSILNRVPQLLHLSGITDMDGNLMPDTVISFIRNEARWGDLVFNEVMADPDPAVDFDEEYIELFNRSEYPVNLENWHLKLNDRDYILSADLVGDYPGQVMGRDSVLDMQPGDYKLITGILLPNEGAVLSLYSREERLIHASSYRIPWNGSEWKKEGGWALESPDPESLCRISANWEFSADPAGGTPGKLNSVQGLREDLDAPVLLYAGLGEAGECLLHYAEPVRFPRGEMKDFILDPGAYTPESAKLIDPLSDILQLRFSEDFHQWNSYRLSLSGLNDCAGNKSQDLVFRAGKIARAVVGSVLVNEIMYDPEEGGPAFVELYLPGEKVYDLYDLSIHLGEEGSIPDHPIPLSSHSRLALPGQYLVLTPSVPHLMEYYGLPLSGQWIELDGLQGMKRNSGVIYLTDRAGNVVDMAVYKDEMHAELLNDPRGVSLERISPERPGSDPANWHSAASIEGYATPGRINSQSAIVQEAGRLLEVSPEVFTPDNDGTGDLLNITLTPGGHDWVVSVWITDLQGNRIRVLANNHVAAPTLRYTWDGEGTNNNMQAMGFYVVHARGYHPPSGEQWVRRRAVGLVYR